MSSEDYFEEIVRDYYEPLFRFAMSLAKNKPDACDLTQQAFYIWAAKGHQLRDHKKVKTWLFTALYRSFLVGRRSQSRYNSEEFEKGAADLPAICDDDAPSVDGSNALAALAQVDEIFQAPLALFYLEDISYTGIAECLQLPIGTVKSRISRGIAQLRKILLLNDSDISLNGSAVVRVERYFSVSHIGEQFALA